MSSVRPFECRFGVGIPEAKHSMVWKVWASKRASDLYITARAMGGSMKASIHASGQRHVGLTEQYVTNAIGRGDWRSGSRHYDLWEGGYQLETGASLEFLIRFPTAHLRQFPLRNSDLTNVVWLPAAPIGEMVEIALLYFLPDLRPEFRSESGRTRIVYKGMLADSRQVWLVARNVPAGEFTNQPDAFREIQVQLL
jgi:hypothetical protein